MEWDVPFALRKSKEEKVVEERAKRLIEVWYQRVWGISSLHSDDITNAVGIQLEEDADENMTSFGLVTSFLVQITEELVNKETRKGVINELERFGHIEDYKMQMRHGDQEGNFYEIPILDVPDIIQDAVTTFLTGIERQSSANPLRVMMDNMRNKKAMISANYPGVNMHMLKELTPVYYTELYERVQNALADRATRTTNLYNMTFELYYNIDHIWEEAWGVYDVPEVVFEYIREYVNRRAIRTAQYGTMESRAEANEAKMQLLLWAKRALLSPDSEFTLLGDLPTEVVYYALLPYARETVSPKGIVLLSLAENYESWIRITLAERVEPRFVVLPEQLASWIGPELEAVQIASESLLSIRNLELRKQRYFSSGGKKSADYERRIEEMNELLKDYQRVQDIITKESHLNFLEQVKGWAKKARGRDIVEIVGDYQRISRVQMVHEMAALIIVAINGKALKDDNIYDILKNMIQRNIIKLNMAMEKIRLEMAKVEGSFGDDGELVHSGKEIRRIKQKRVSCSERKILIISGKVHSSLEKYACNKNVNSHEEERKREDVKLFF